MATDTPSVDVNFEQGISIGDKEALNVIITMSNSAEAKEVQNRSNFDKSAQSLEMHQKTFLAYRKATLSDDTLNQDQKDYLIHKAIIDYQKSGNAILDSMQTDQDDLERTYTQALYINSFEMNAYSTAMLSSGAINDAVLSDPDKFTDNALVSTLVALHARADMYTPQQSERIAKNLNNKWTPDKVEGLEVVALNKQRIDAARKGLSRQGGLLSISAERYNKLNASVKLREANKKMGVTF